MSSLGERSHSECPTDAGRPRRYQIASQNLSSPSVVWGPGRAVRWFEAYGALLEDHRTEEESSSGSVSDSEGRRSGGSSRDQTSSAKPCSRSLAAEFNVSRSAAEVIVMKADFLLDV